MSARSERKRMRAEMAGELTGIETSLRALDRLPTVDRRAEQDRIRRTLLDLDERMEADKQARPRDYELWSRWRVVRFMQRWRAFG